MTFSFTSPTHKPIFTTLTRSWIACFFASFLVVMIILFVLDEQTLLMSEQTTAINAEIDKQSIVKKGLQDRIDYLDTQIQQISHIKQDNTALLSGIDNLLGIFPEQITINTISLDNNNLIIKGITPSKELYIFLLEPPLRAIFDESNVDFFVLPSGWYNFVSVSKINKPQGNSNGQQ